MVIWKWLHRPTEFVVVINLPKRRLFCLSNLILRVSLLPEEGSKRDHWNEVVSDPDSHILNNHRRLLVPDHFAREFFFIPLDQIAQYLHFVL